MTGDARDEAYTNDEVLEASPDGNLILLAYEEFVQDLAQIFQDVCKSNFLQLQLVVTPNLQSFTSTENGNCNTIECHTAHPAKIYLNKKWLPKQKTIQNFNIDAQGFRKTRNENSPTHEGIDIEILNGLLLW